MIEIYLLEQLIALDDCGTLSEAAKKNSPDTAYINPIHEKTGK